MAAMIAVQSLIERNVLYGHTVPGLVLVSEFVIQCSETDSTDYLSAD